MLAHHNLLQKPNEKEICYIAYTFDNGTLINLSRVDRFKQKSGIFVAFLITVVVVPEDSMTCFLIIVCWKIPSPSLLCFWSDQVYSLALIDCWKGKKFLKSAFWSLGNKKILHAVFDNAPYMYIQDWFLFVGKCVCGWTLNIDYWTFFPWLAATKQSDWFFKPASPIRENIFQRFWHIHKTKCTLRAGHNS